MEVTLPTLANYLSWAMTPRQICDVELILNKGFAPLAGFLGKADYESVLETMRLADGTVWPMPVTLDISQAFSKQLSLRDTIVLRDLEGLPVATLKVAEMWEPDLSIEAKAVFGSLDEKHPAVNYLLNKSNPVYISGVLEQLTLPTHYDYTNLRLTPDSLKERFAAMGCDKVVAFQTRNPMHRAHQELTIRAAKEQGAHLLIHPVVGMTKPGDIDHFSRVRCYQKVLQTYPKDSATLSLLPLAMRMGGPREALWHAIIRKNYGCTHFIIGRDHAGPGNDSTGKPFYDPYAAQELVAQYQDEVGIKMVPFQEMVYVKSKRHYEPASEVKDQSDIARISGTEFRRLLRANEAIPEWFSFPEVIAELRRTIPEKNKQGLVLFFTGLSGAGKSTIARALVEKLMETGQRAVTLLDGDVVRQHLSSELGFSKAHRDLNIQRIGYVASEIARHGGIAVCAPIAPYAKTRDSVREMVSEHGVFMEIFISTSLEVCESRDPKGLYAKARAGVLKGFTGIDDPYEKPPQPEITIDTSKQTVLEEVNAILNVLISKGCIHQIEKDLENAETRGDCRKSHQELHESV